jgi:hypothetical protein
MHGDPPDGAVLWRCSPLAKTIVAGPSATEMDNATVRSFERQRTRCPPMVDRHPSFLTAEFSPREDTLYMPARIFTAWPLREA